MSSFPTSHQWKTEGSKIVLNLEHSLPHSKLCFLWQYISMKDLVNFCVGYSAFPHQIHSLFCLVLCLRRWPLWNALSKLPYPLGLFVDLVNGKHSVFICLGCYNKILDWVAYKNRNWLLTVLEKGCLRSVSRYGCMRTLFWVTDFLLYFCVAEGARSSVQPLLRTLISCMRVLPLRLKHFPKASSTKTITFGG